MVSALVNVFGLAADELLIESVPIVAVAGPDTPSTVGLGEFALIVTVAPPVGATPVDQLPPTVQSLLVVPVQTCALAGDDQPPMASAAAPRHAATAWRRPEPPPLLPRPAVNSEATTHVPIAPDQTTRNL